MAMEELSRPPLTGGGGGWGGAGPLPARPGWFPAGQTPPQGVPPACSLVTPPQESPACSGLRSHPPTAVPPTLDKPTLWLHAGVANGGVS